MRDHGDELHAEAGPLAAFLRSGDWSRSALGPPAGWPEHLCTALRLCLASPVAGALYWGEALALLYNDAWRTALGPRHPSSLGRPAAEAWPEPWDAVDAHAARVLATGQEILLCDELFPVHRHGRPEEAYFTAAYSPVRSASGRVDGVSNVILETTRHTLGERRLRSLRELGARAPAAGSREAACRAAAEVVAKNAADVPFLLLYLVRSAEGIAELVASAGLEAGAPASPNRLALDPAGDDGPGWPLGSVLRDGPKVVGDLAERFGPLPGGPWPECATCALVDRMPLATSEAPEAIIVAGVSPRLPLDGDYREYLTAISRQIAGAMAGARGRRLRELNDALEQRVRESTRDLQASESRFHELFRASPIPIVVTAPDGLLADVNPAFERLTGYGRADAVGHDAGDVGLWSSGEDRRRVADAAAATDGPDQGSSGVEAHLVTKDGRSLDVLVSVSRATFADQTGSLHMVVDISERKRSERQLAQALQEVMKDTSWLARSVFEKLAELRGKPSGRSTPIADLTARERDVLYLVAGARSNRDIGRELGLAPSTVRNYIAALYTKMGVRTRAEAVVWARERGLGGA